MEYEGPFDFNDLVTMIQRWTFERGFDRKLEKNFEQALAAIEANKSVAKDQSEVLSAALSKANIDIVGGEGAFFDNFAKALSVGKAVEGVAGKSPIVQDLISKFLSGKGGASLLNALGDGKGLPPTQRVD